MDERRGEATSLARARALIVVAITALTGVAIVAGVTTSMAPLIVVFVLVCPGLALVGALRLRDPLFEIVLGVALSVSIAGLLATVELFLEAWAPIPTLGVLVAISVAGLLLDAGLIRRRAWATAAARRSAAGLQRRYQGGGSSPGEPGRPDVPATLVSSPVTLATPVSSPATGPIVSTTAATTAIAASARPRTVPAMGPMLVMADASRPPDPAEAPASPTAPAASDGPPSADQVGPSTPTPAPAGPVSGPGRRGRPKDVGEPPPPPTIIVARRLPEELRPKPPAAGRRGRPKAAVADEAPGAAEPTRSLRSAVRDVVGDVADRRDGKR